MANLVLPMAGNVWKINVAVGEAKIFSRATPTRSGPSQD